MLRYCRVVRRKHRDRTRRYVIGRRYLLPLTRVDMRRISRRSTISVSLRGLNRIRELRGETGLCVIVQKGLRHGSINERVRGCIRVAYRSRKVSRVCVMTYLLLHWIWLVGRTMMRSREAVNRTIRCHVVRWSRRHGAPMRVLLIWMMRRGAVHNGHGKSEYMRVDPLLHGKNVREMVNLSRKNVCCT